RPATLPGEVYGESRVPHALQHPHHAVETMPCLGNSAGGVERGDEGRTALAQPLQMLGHRTFLSVSGSSARMSSSTSAKAYIPGRPTIQRAASSAPAAKAARERAV